MDSVGPRHSDDQDPARVDPAGRGMLSALVALVRDTRGDGSMTVRYIQCDACGGPTPHHAEVQIFSATSQDPTFIASPPEVVCGICASVHPRVVDDEPPLDTELTCATRGPRPWPVGRFVPDRWLTRRWLGACTHRFAVPAAAATVVCPRCATNQPGPASRPARDHP
ncbi:hypothetical protein [Pseudofrankia sp. BMG5.36]|uniref:hypothetical protein n=1 Tax=Pseudofrankia sp. BMG5.36 TaxID=1834512 RepID=UPI0008D91976|nr:hypothetical protein [Pseudofrankia sp. BMG5.36]OHV44372.1 hypothetical protein BCD48_02145 [Pseudofrankia sp. BMG5.36]